MTSNASIPRIGIKIVVPGAKGEDERLGVRAQIEVQSRHGRPNARAMRVDGVIVIIIVILEHADPRDACPFVCGAVEGGAIAGFVFARCDTRGEGHPIVARIVIHQKHQGVFHAGAHADADPLAVGGRAEVHVEIDIVIIADGREREGQVASTRIDAV